MNKIFLILVSIFFASTVAGQSDSTDTKYIVVEGKIVDQFGHNINNAIIVNTGSLYGVFGNFDGTFKIELYPGEKLSIRAVGKQTRTISFSDSIPKDYYFVNVTLKNLEFDISQVTIFAPRDLDKIHDDIQDLGYNKEDYMLSGIEAAFSPITFLYQQFSKKEQEKRKAKELINEDRKRDLLKELFSKYADYDIVDLENKEFDEFVDFLNVSDSFMKNSSQYEFVVYVKQRFNDFVIYKRNKGLDDSDYDYDRN